ncbi:MAG: efflux RND transporter periplasmic adaptor subunit [Woeseiaceae bacterium]|nr:efflux RND transporter periplasmic adaptor subunit [Woeseiaceae bacterium]
MNPIKTRNCRRRRPGRMTGSIALVMSLWLAGPASAQDTTPPLETVAAVLEEAPLEQLYDGTVEAVNQATVSAQTAGRIAAIHFDIDDYVEAGETIMRFTDVEQQAALESALAGLEEALARQQEATEEFTRAESLYESGSGSKREYDQALAARDSAVARVTAARSAVARARQQVDYTRVKAPYAGIVTERHVEVGESVTVGQPLMSGLSLEALRVKVDLPQAAANELRARRAAVVITGDGRIEPTAIVVFPFADEATNTFRARLELPEGQFGLYPGMFAKVAVTVGEAERLLVPAAALVRRSEVTGVYVVDPDNGVRLRQVRTGNRFGDRVEILAGLAPGERVATDPVRAGIYLKTRAATDGG